MFQLWKKSDGHLIIGFLALVLAMVCCGVWGALSVSVGRSPRLPDWIPLALLAGWYCVIWSCGRLYLYLTAR